MSYYGASAGAAATAAIANAIKASGAIVSVAPHDFAVILEGSEEPLVVHAEYGIFSKKHHYLTGYKGLVFYTKADVPLPLPETAEFIEAKRIWIPG